MSFVTLLRLPFAPTDLAPHDFFTLAATLAEAGVPLRPFDANIDFYHAAPKQIVENWLELPVPRQTRKAFIAEFSEPIEAYLERLLDRESDEETTFLVEVSLESIDLVLRHVRHFNRLAQRATLLLFGSSIDVDGERKELEQCVDFHFAIAGRPENALLNYFAGQNPRYLPGFIAKKDAQILYRNKTVPSKDFYRLPFPDPGSMKLDSYTGDVLPLRSSMGCPRRCFHCHDISTAPFHFVRTPLSVFVYLKMAVEEYHIRTFRFIDHAVNGDPETLLNWTGAIVREKLDLTWSGTFLVDLRLDYLMAKQLRRSGLSHCVLKVFSGSDHVLDLMNAGFSSSHASEVIKNLAANKIEVNIVLTLGFPGEREDHLVETERFLYDHRKLIKRIDQLDPVYIFPKTRLERKPDKFGIALPPEDHASTWTYGQKNDREYRTKLRNRFARHAAKIGIHGTESIIVAPIQGAKPTSRPALILTSVPPSGINNPPIGLAYLAEFMHRHSIETLVHDFNIHLFNVLPPEYAMLWHVENKNYWSNPLSLNFLVDCFSEHIDSYVNTLLSFEAKVIGFSVCDPKERLTIEVIRRIRRHDSRVKIILGGPACFTGAYRRIFTDNARDSIDGYCVVGEGEHVLLEVMRRVAAGNDLIGIKGLLVYTDPDAYWYQPRSYTKVLDTIPQPGYADFDLGHYHSSELLIEWSRGCISRCRFCKGVQICGAFRCRSPRNKVEELRYLTDRYRIKDFTIVDLVLNGDLENLEKTFDLIIENKLEITWKAEALPLPGMSDRLIHKMRKAGCDHLQLGVECGSDTVLKSMNKHFLFDVKTAEDVIRRVHLAGIRTCLFWQVGFPGEGPDEFNESVEFLQRNASSIDELKSINATHIITDTPLHRMADKYGIDLPEKDYHYLWSMPGNDNLERRRRIKVLLRLAEENAIFVRETNLSEGKQYDEIIPLLASETIALGEKKRTFIAKINKLESFDHRGSEPRSDDPSSPDDFVELKSRVELIAKSMVNHLRKGSNKGNHSRPDRRNAEGAIRARSILSKGKAQLGPSFVEIDLVDYCNFDCIGCWTNSAGVIAEKSGKHRLDLDKLCRFIDAVAERGAKIIQLSGGGEPFLHPNIIEIARRIKGHGLEVRLISNFSLPDQKQIEELVMLDLEMITISIWADRRETFVNTYPKTSPAQFDRVIGNIRHLVAFRNKNGKKNPLVKIYPVISSVNASSLYSFYRLAAELGVDQLEFALAEILPGKTDFLALDERTKGQILEDAGRLEREIDSPLQFRDERLEDAENALREHRDLYRYLRTKEIDRFRLRLVATMTCPIGHRKIVFRDDDPLGTPQLVLDFSEMNCTVCAVNRHCDLCHNPRTIRIEGGPRDYIFRLLNQVFRKKDHDFPQWFKNDYELFFNLAKKNFRLTFLPTLICPVEKTSSDFGVAGGDEDLLLFDCRAFSCEDCVHFDRCGLKKTEKCFFDEGYWKTTNRWMGFPLFPIKRFSTFIEKVKNSGFSMNEGRDLIANPCSIGYLYTRIAATGQVVPCCKAGNFSIGSILDKPFFELWNGERMDYFRSIGMNENALGERLNLIDCHHCDNRGLLLDLAATLETLKPTIKLNDEDENRAERIVLFLSRS